MKCTKCGSFAINHHLHGRDGTDSDLCDVCYWRMRAKPDIAKDAARYQHIKGMSRAMSADIGGNHSWTIMLTGIRGPSLDEAIDNAIGKVKS